MPPWPAIISTHQRWSDGPTEGDEEDGSEEDNTSKDEGNEEDNNEGDDSEQDGDVFNRSPSSAGHLLK